MKTLSNIKYFDCKYWHPRRLPFCILHLVPHSADWRRRKQLLGDYTATCFWGNQESRKVLLFYTCCRPQYIIQQHVFEGIKNEEKSLLFYTCYGPKQLLGHDTQYIIQRLVFEGIKNEQKSLLFFTVVLHLLQTKTIAWTWYTIYYTATCFEGIKNEEKSLLFYTCCRPKQLLWLDTLYDNSLKGAVHKWRHLFQGVSRPL